MPPLRMQPSESRAQEMESRWESRIEAALESLQKGQADMVSKFAQMGIENAEQHGDLESKVMSLDSSVRALDRRIDEILKKGLEDASEKLVSAKKLVRWLTYAVVVLASMIAGAKAHALGWIKDIGL